MDCEVLAREGENLTRLQRWLDSGEQSCSVCDSCRPSRGAYEVVEWAGSKRQKNVQACLHLMRQNQILRLQLAELGNSVKAELCEAELQRTIRNVNGRNDRPGEITPTLASVDVSRGSDNLPSQRGENWSHAGTSLAQPNPHDRPPHTHGLKNMTTYNSLMRHLLGEVEVDTGQKTLDPAPRGLGEGRGESWDDEHELRKVVVLT